LLNSWRTEKKLSLFSPDLDVYLIVSGYKMDRRSWMYNISRHSESFRRELDKFLKVAQNHAMDEKTKDVRCPCKNCRNHCVFDDLVTIRSHVLVHGFVKDPEYTIWTYHGEKENPDFVAEMQDVWGDREAVNRYFEGYDEDYGFEDDGSDEGVDYGPRGCDGVVGSGEDIAGNEGTEDIVGDQGAGSGVDEFDDSDFLGQLLHNTMPELLVGSAKGEQNVEALKRAAEETVYERSKGCPRHWTLLRFILELLILKAKYGWSDVSFNDLLRILAWLLPKPNKVPKNTYRAKKIISPFTMGVQRIHACPNHCILYRGDAYKNLDKCPVCGAKRYKNNAGYCGREEKDQTDEIKRKRRGGSVVSNEKPDTCLGDDDSKQRRIPCLVVWYLPVADRLRRMFSNPSDAELMRWWDSDKRKKGDGKIRHPADGTQWQKFDEKYKEFARDPRNVRFALDTDGMNPFGERRSNHSTWPVVMSMFNLPTWLCQKRKYLFLCILIQGPKHPGLDIDVFLEPLLEEMAKLWNHGIKMIDAFTQQEFTLRAMIFVTINDYQALFVLSGQTKGRTACP